MRSVAAPRLNMSSFVISVEHKDPYNAAVPKGPAFSFLNYSGGMSGGDSTKPGDDDGLHQLLSTFRYFARAHEPAAPRHDMS